MEHDAHYVRSAAAARNGENITIFGDAAPGVVLFVTQLPPTKVGGLV